MWANNKVRMNWVDGKDRTKNDSELTLYECDLWNELTKAFFFWVIRLENQLIGTWKVHGIYSFGRCNGHNIVTLIT